MPLNARQLPPEAEQGRDSQAADALQWLTREAGVPDHPSEVAKWRAQRSTASHPASASQTRSPA